MGASPKFPMHSLKIYRGRRGEVYVAKRYAASFSFTCIERSPCGISRFLQYCEKHTPGEIAGAHHISAQHHNVVFVDFGYGAGLCEGRAMSIC